MMDKYTFSDSPAAQHLAELLSQPEYHKARETITKWMEYSAAIMDIQLEVARRGTLNYWKQHFLRRAEALHLPSEVESHMKNVIVGRFRELIKAVL